MRHAARILLLVLGLALCGSSGVVSAQAAEAKVLKIVGNAAAVSLVGQRVPVRQGMALPVGTRIATGAGVEVYIEAVDGVVAMIKQNSEVAIAALGNAENRTLDLRRGSIISQIDPKRHKKDSYGVKNPKGIAAARGTVYTVSVRGQSHAVLTMSGTVALTPTGGRAEDVMTIGPGGVSMTGVNGGRVATAADAANDPVTNATVTDAAAFAVASVASVAVDAGTFGSASGRALTELGETLITVVQRIPQATAPAVMSASASAPSLASSMVTMAATVAVSSDEVGAVATTAAEAAARGAASTAANVAAAASYAEAIAQAAARAAATADPLRAASAAMDIAQATALGATQGALQAGLFPDETGTAIAASAAQGAAQGAAGIVPDQAANIAAGAAQGAMDGVTNAGATNVNGSMVSSGAADGASVGSGIPAAPPPAPKSREPSVSTPSTPISPKNKVNPSN